MCIGGLQPRALGHPGLERRGSLTVWMSPNLPWLEKGGHGATSRPQVYTDAAIQAVLTLKVIVQARPAAGLRAGP